MRSANVHKRLLSRQRPVVAERLFLFVAAFGVVVIGQAAVAQDDAAAGLMTPAGDVPLVGQAVSVNVMGDRAKVVLAQTFANDATAFRQADYRVTLPRAATVTGFGFYNGGVFHAATLKDRTAAQQAHRRAAEAGRATGLAQQDDVTHAFTVFPLRPGERKRLIVELDLPVTVLNGLSSVRLPLATFAGQSRKSESAATTFLAPQTPVTATVRADTAIAEVQLAGAQGATVLGDVEKTATIVGHSRTSVELRWRQKGAPLSVQAFEVPLDDGSRGVEVAVTFTDLASAQSAHPRLQRGEHPREVLVLVDGSASMRRQVGPLTTALEHLLKAPAPARLFSVAEKKLTEIEISPAAPFDAGRTAKKIVDGHAGHRLTKAALKRATRQLGCGRQSVRCVVLTDGQLEALQWAVKSEWATLVLADAEAVDRELTALSTTSKTNVFINGVGTSSQLRSLVDEVVRPALKISLASIGRQVLSFRGRPNLRVAEGGQKRFVAVVPKSRRAGKTLTVDVQVAGKTLALKADVQRMKRKSPRGIDVRKRVYKGILDDMLRQYAKKPSEQGRKNIVKLSLRENIPTRLTAWHVEDERSAPGPTDGTSFTRKTVIDFSGEDIRGDLVKPSGALGGLMARSSGDGTGGIDVGGRDRHGGRVKSGRFELSTVGRSTAGFGGLGIRGVGRGGGGVRRHVKRLPSVVAGAVKVRGAVDKSAIKRVMRVRMGMFQMCYDRQLKRHRHLSGKIGLQISVRADGRVADASIASDTLKDAKVATCILLSLKRLRFPKPRGGGTVKFSYTMVFQKDGDTPKTPATGDDAEKDKGPLSTKKRIPPTVRPAKAEPLSTATVSVDREQVERVMRRNLTRIRFCYDKVLAKRPDVSGRLNVSFVVGTTGLVTSAKVEEGTLNDAEVASCVVNVIKRIRFKRSAGGDPMTITYPLFLHPAG